MFSDDIFGGGMSSPFGGLGGFFGGMGGSMVGRRRGPSKGEDTVHKLKWVTNLNKVIMKKIFIGIYN